MFHVWNSPCRLLAEDQLNVEAQCLNRINRLPEVLTEWKKYRRKLIAQIREKLGTASDNKLNLDLKIHGKIKMKGYSVKKITYQSRPGFYVTGNLYIPDGKGPFPAVINMHGHWEQGRLAERVQQRGHSLAANGYVCLCVDAFGSGERSTVHGEFEYHGGHLGASLMDIGETLMGMQVVDNMRGVDLLCSLACVNAERIGATGASGGGNQTMWLTAMDERIKASIPVVSVGTFQSYVNHRNCICEVLPDGLTFTEEDGVLAIAAPRAICIFTAMHDSRTFHPIEMLRSYESALKIYALYGKRANFSHRIFNAQHGYWPEMRELMLGWFDKHLKGEGDGQPVTEKHFDTLPEETLMCFAKGSRPPEVKSIAVYCREKGEKLRARTNATIAFSADKKRKQLLEILHADDTWSVSKISKHFNKRMFARSWDAFTVRSGEGTIFPVIAGLPRNGSRKFLIAVPPATSGGKLDLKNDDIFKRFAVGNDGIILFDLWGAGEIGSDITAPAICVHHDLARSCLWTGKRLMGEWVKSVKLMKKFAEFLCKGCRIALAGWNEGALVALFAAATDIAIGEVTLVNLPASLLFGEKTASMSMGVHVPGFLKWGDISLVAALCRKMPEFVALATIDGCKLSKDDEKRFLKETKSLRRKLR